MINNAPVSVVIPTFNRSHKLIVTIQSLLNCNPQPAEIIVHVDGGDDRTASILRSKYRSVRIIESAHRVGPGGGRNALIATASNEFVASFDDDSYPLDSDYFYTLVKYFDQYANVAVIAAVIVYEGESVSSSTIAASWVADFVGCGCAYRRSAFLST